MPQYPREDFIHLAIRKHLRQTGWTLLAGQFPGGSDHELKRLYLRDPEVARDNSPDPRRHSMASFVPDLVASRGVFLLLVEMKSEFSSEDLRKLRLIVDHRCADLRSALSTGLGLVLIDCSSVVIALGFSSSSKRPKTSVPHLLLVRSLDEVSEEPSLP
jgi:hypothetical protein